MAIKARRRIIRIRPKPKSKHVKLCEDLCNRLHEYDDTALEQALALFDADTPDALLLRTSSQVSTIQLNDEETFRCYMQWEDRREKPKHGYLYPALASVKSSTVMSFAVILAATEIAKRAGTFEL
jgi:hypothetical protein